MNHSEIEEMLGVYALDALSADEAETIELHLGECPRCRAEVAEHREVAAALAFAGAPAPPQVWSRIAESLEEPPPSLDLGRVVRIDDRRRNVPARPVAALVAAAALVITVLGVEVSRQDDRIDNLASALQETGLDEAVQSALLDEGARKVELVSEDKRMFAQTVVQENGDGYLVRHNLPPLPKDLTYQVWAFVGERPVSIGVLGPSPTVAAFKVAAEGVAVLAVTTEPAGGVVAPTKAPVVRGFLPVT